MCATFQKTAIMFPASVRPSMQIQPLHIREPAVGFSTLAVSVGSARSPSFCLHFPSDPRCWET